MSNNKYQLLAQLSDGTWQTRETFDANQRERAKGAARDLMRNTDCYRIITVARVDAGGDLDRIFWVLPDGSEGV